MLPKAHILSQLENFMRPLQMLRLTTFAVSGLVITVNSIAAILLANIDALDRWRLGASLGSVYYSSELAAGAGTDLTSMSVTVVCAFSVEQTLDRKQRRRRSHAMVVLLRQWLWSSGYRRSVCLCRHCSSWVCQSACTFDDDSLSDEVLCLWNCSVHQVEQDLPSFLHQCYRLISRFVCLLFCRDWYFGEGCSVCRTNCFCWHWVLQSSTRWTEKPYVSTIVTATPYSLE